MANKVLTIDVEPKSVPNGSTNQWTPLTNTGVFIGDILTPPLSEGTNIGALVSGIPTAFARVDLFHNAIKNGHEDAARTQVKNLNTYYIELLNEWKGFIAALALDYANFEARRIDLSYSDGKDIADTANIYEPKGAFGNMLLERRRRWMPVGRDVTDATPPFINVVKYRNGVVGATSPETLLFTSSGYSIDTGQDSLPWVRGGRFTDPLEGSMSEDQIISLYAYINYIIKNLDKIANYYAPLHDEFVNYTPHRQVLERWRDKIGEYAAERGYDLSKGTIPAVPVGFSEPFSEVFIFSDTLYSTDGVITEQQREGAMPFDPKKLLLGSSARIARIHLDAAFTTQPEKIRELPVHVLKASFKNEPGSYAYFALPLSARGIDVFGKSIGTLVGNAAVGQVGAHRLTAEYDPDAPGKNLSVTLHITTETGKTRTFKENYEIGNEDGVRNHDLLLWPNFVSRQWNTYYLYSEMPHAVSTNTYSAYPFVGDPARNFRIVTGDGYNPLPLADKNLATADGTELPDGTVLSVSLPVQATAAIAENGYKYEIYRSNLPFKGVRLVSPTRAEGGYLLINYTQEPDRKTLPRDLLDSLRSLRKVTLGVDFGSTNTSLAFSEENGSPEGFSFGRQRVSLLGNDLPGSRKRSVPQPNQVLFFQSRETPLPSNAIKSILTLHNPLRLHPLAKGATEAMRAAEAVAGGFPCFMENLPVKEVENDTILLQYPRIGQVEQIHNMKWNDRELDKSRKTAYLRTLLLQVYAELFANGGYVPDKLVWSYPSAMDKPLLLSYQQIWNELGGLKVSPVSDEYNHQVSLEVSRYTLSGGFGDTGGDDPFGNVKSAEDPFGTGGGDAFGSDNPFGGGDPFGGDPFGAPAQPAQASQPAEGGFGPDVFGSGEPSGGNDAFGGFGADPFGGNTATPSAQKQERPDLKPDDPKRVVDLKPKPLFPEGYDLNSLTEATAVANFTSEIEGQRAGVLNLCFDIGGSTSDISALWMLPQGVTMIKQNSIRFAAMLVSQATRHLPEFENVLRKVCAQTQTSLLGLNEGDKRFSSDTAPYYFEQIVDRFDDNQLQILYQTIGADCPRLMFVNLYVTGLLMFYAGQIARKLIDDLAHLTPAERPTARPIVTVTFAGKGSRLFQWMSILPNNRDAVYYREMFVAGYGREALVNSLAGWPRIELPKDDRSKNIKYEVSKGLAKGNPKLLIPEGGNEAEIVSESNFEVIDARNQAHRVNDINTLTPEMIRFIGRYFNPVNNALCDRFIAFSGLYFKAIAGLFGKRLNQQAFNVAFKDMNIVQYVQSRPEFKAAMRAAESGEPFDYVAPLIILEGMKFYDKYLIRALG